MPRKKNTRETGKLEEPLSAYGDGPLTFEKVWLMFQETDKQFKETDRTLSERFRETDKKIKDLSDLFNSQWGRLVESLVEGAVIRIFREAGIEVYYTSERVKGNAGRENFEFDIVAYNDKDLVVIEVKTTLRPADVKTFLAKLKKIKTWIPAYRDRHIRGSVAFLTAQAGSEIQAQNAGLYTIKATGDSAYLLNPPGFEPRIF